MTATTKREFKIHPLPTLPSRGTIRNVKQERGIGLKGRRNANARACGARGRTVRREGKRVSTTGGGRPNVVSATVQRDKQLKRDRRVHRKSVPLCRVSIHPSVVYTTCLLRRRNERNANDRQFRPRLRMRSRFPVESFFLSLFLSGVRKSNYIYTHIHTCTRRYNRRTAHTVYIFLFLYVAYYYYVHAHRSTCLLPFLCIPLLFSFLSLPSSPLSRARRIVSTRYRAVAQSSPRERRALRRWS